MRIKIVAPSLIGIDMENITGRENFNALLTNKGIKNWGYHYGQNSNIPVFEATVPDDFDLTKIQEYGTIEILEEEGT